METKTWINITLGMAIFANVLQMIGFVAPMWIWIQKGSFVVGVGLWYASGCGIDGTCNNSTPSVSYSYSADDTFRKSDFKAVQALEIIGTAGGVLVILFMILYKMGYAKWRLFYYLHLTAFITCFITWLFILIGVIVFCGTYWPVVGTSPLISSVSFPWSMLMCLFAGIIFILVCALIRIKCYDSDFVKHAIPISGDAQMDLHPVTKQGFWHRYFTPAYHETRRPNYAIPMPNEGFGVGGASGRLVNGIEERRAITGVDNMAFEGNGLESGFNYRYLPPATMDPIPRPHTHSIVRQSSIPPGNYGDADNSVVDNYRYRGQDTTYTTVNKGVTGERPTTISRDSAREPSVITSRELPGYYADGGAMARDVTYNTRYVTTRQSSYQVPPVSRMESQDQYVTRIDVPAPLNRVSTKSYVAGLSDSPHYLLANNAVDSRFTNDGRLTANADYLSAEYRRSDRAASQVGSNVSGSALQYTTHLGPLGPAPRSVLYGAGGANLFHPTYIHRPSSQQMY